MKIKSVIRNSTITKWLSFYEKHIFDFTTSFCATVVFLRYFGFKCLCLTYDYQMVGTLRFFFFFLANMFHELFHCWISKRGHTFVTSAWKGAWGVRVLKFPLHMFMDSIVFKNVSNNKSMVYLCGCAFWLVETLWLVENIISECLNYSSIVSKDSMNRFNEMFSLARMLAVMHRGFLTPHPRVAPKMLILNRVKMRSSILQNNNIKQKANWR